MPIVASFFLCVFVVAPSPKTHTENTREHKDIEAATSDYATSISISAGDISMMSMEEHNISDHISDSRWNRFTIILHATYISWFVLATAMAFGRLLTYSVAVDKLYILTGCTGVSMWSVYSVTRRWTRFSKMIPCDLPEHVLCIVSNGGHTFHLSVLNLFT